MNVNIGDVISLISGLAALVTVVFAWRTVTEAKALREAFTKAINTAQETDRRATADRQRAADAAMTERTQAEQQRLARRVERVADLVEDLFWAAGDDRATDSTLWLDIRNRLRHAMPGLRERLPNCAEASNASTRARALQAATLARNEADNELERLYGQMTQPS